MKKKKLFKRLMASILVTGSIGMPTTNVSAQNQHKQHHHCTVPIQQKGLTEIEQPDGSKIKIKIVGNAFNFNVESEDGFTLVKNKDGIFEYATPGPNGSLIPNGIIAKNNISKLSSKNKSSTNLTKHLRYTGSTLEKKINAQTKFLTPSEDLAKKAIQNKSFNSAKGEINHLLILIDFPDNPSTHLTAEFDSLMNQRTGFNVNGATGSFKEYYFDNSYGQLTVNTDVIGWYTADNPYINYVTHSFTDTNASWSNARLLAREAIDAAEADGVDFSKYDNDKDGIIDVVTITHADIGAEYQFIEHAIWSHKWSIDDSTGVTYDNTQINAYTMNPERQPFFDANDDFIGFNLTGLGVYAHEFGHALGLPDLYDTYCFLGCGFGPSRWSIMASGGYNNQQNTPADFDPWCKEFLDWIQPTVLSGNGEVINMENSGNSQESYRINTLDPEEYFLFVNQQRDNKWNAELRGNGLTIWHINNPAGDFALQFNGVNAFAGHERVMIEQADGLEDLSAARRGADGGDPFPGTSNNTTFNNGSIPNSNSGFGPKTNVNISNITENAELISFNYFAPSTVEQRITAEADAMVKSGKHSETPFGNLDKLKVHMNNPDGIDKKSYIRFDLSSITSAEEITSAKVRLYSKRAGRNATSTNYKIGWVSQDNWSEDGAGAITWANAPSIPSGNIGFFKGVSATEYVDIDLTDWIKWEKENVSTQGDKFSLAISTLLNHNDPSYRNIVFASRENPNEALRPVLIINEKIDNHNGSFFSLIPHAPQAANAAAVSSFTKDESNISLFPNPASNLVNIGIGDPELEGEIEIKLYSLLGKVVYNKQYSAIAGTPFKTTLPLDNVKQGMYLMNITVNNKQYSTLRFVKN